MPLALVTSPSAAARVDRAAAWLRRRRPSERVLVLGASMEAASELARGVAARGKAAFGWHRLTLGRLAAQLATPALVARGLVPVGTLALEAICARAIDGLARRGALGRLAPVADRPGLPRAVARTLNEARLAGLEADALAVAELDGVYEAFEVELERARLSDRALVLRLATERAADPEARHPLLGLPMLLLDVPVSFELERDLIAALAARSPDALATVPAGDARSEEHLFTAFGVPWERLAPAAADSSAGAAGGSAGAAGAGAGGTSASLARLQAHLFEELDEEDVAGLGDDVVVLSAPGESRECVEIARLALREAARGVPFDRMAVLLRAPEQYRAHIEEALRRAGIPAYFAQGSVRPDPAGRALLALLACAAEGLSASRFAEYLSLGQVPDATAEGAPPPAPADGERWVPPDEEMFPEAMLRDALEELAFDDDPGEGVEAGGGARGLSIASAATRSSAGSGHVAGARAGRGQRERRGRGRDAEERPRDGEDLPRDGEDLPRDGDGFPREDDGFPRDAEEALPEGDGGLPDGADAGGPDVEDVEATADGAPPVADGTLRAPRRWEKILVDAAVIGGIDRWERRLAGFEAGVRLDLESAKEQRDVDRATRTLADLEALRGFALPLLAALPDRSERRLWGQWLDRLSALTSRALRRPERVLAVLAELAPMAAVGPVDLNEVRLVLANRLTELLQPPPDRRAARLFVAPIDAARGRAFDVVFVPGLAEKIFPQKVTEDPILRDALRRRIAAGAGATATGRLETSDDRVAKERLALRLAVGAARQRLVVSYPRVDMDQSRPRVPSFYGLELLRAAEGRLPGFGELASRAEQGGAARIGWPAPARPQDAIDAAEHDLALLETLFHQPEEQTIGTARYLLSVNPHLARALRFRARRWIPGWTSADGLFRPIPEAREALRAHSFSERSFSPTALQHFAACPYKFFLYAVHRLRPREVPEAIEEIPPLRRGSLVHEALYRVLVALRDAGKLPVTRATLDDARDELDRALDQVAAEFKDDLAPAIDRVWADGIASVRADLREWLRRAADEEEWVPTHFELSFGLPRQRKRDPASRDEPALLGCGVQLRGSIDLVEQSSFSGAMRATDYKTGRVRTEREAIVAGGETLQPVLYALTLEKMMPPGTEVHSGRLYYCTSAGGFTELPILLNDRARAAADEVVSIIGDALDKAALLAVPSPGACTYCEYRPVCGPYEELRANKIKRQDVDHVRQLVKLRRLE